MGPSSPPTLRDAQDSVPPAPGPTLGSRSPGCQRLVHTALPPACSVSDDPEQSLQVETSPGPARPVTAAQTPLLSRFLGVGAPSPAISLRNFGRVRGAPRTPHLLRFRAEEGGDLEATDRIEEEALGSGDEAQEP